MFSCRSIEGNNSIAFFYGYHLIIALSQVNLRRDYKSLHKKQVFACELAYNRLNPIFLTMNKEQQIKKYLEPNRYTTDRDEPCTSHVGLKVPASLKAELDRSKGWQEFARKALKEYVQLKSA